MSNILGDVLPQHRFDVSRLEKYMQSNVAKFSGPLKTLKQFTSGESNPTFLLVDNNNNKYVLRKKPPGKLHIKKAHNVGREYRIMKSLEVTQVPVPIMYCLCTDSSIIGTDFYIMEFVEGRIVKKIEEVEPQQRNAMFSELIRVLALIHSVDIDEVGLGDFGSKGDYCERSLAVYGKSYDKAKAYPISSFEKLRTKLGENVPKEERRGIVHGDFRLDNCIFHPTQPRILAVLDWELSTTGNPLADVGYLCIPMAVRPQFVTGNANFSMVPFADKRVFSEYCKHASRHNIQQLYWFVAFSLYRLSSVCVGVQRRVMQGNSLTSKSSEKWGELADLCAREALFVMEKYGDVTVGVDEGLAISPTAWLNQRSAYTTKALQINSTLFPISKKALDTIIHLNDFMNEHVFPNEKTYINQKLNLKSRWDPIPIVEELKEKAKEAGLWNLFLAEISHFSNLEYAQMAELMGQVMWSPEVFNCGAPDTGNMEILFRFGTEEQKNKYLEPLLRGEIRSCFAMTEPAVASSDARNIGTSIRSDGDHYIINGTKWYISGAGDKRCKLIIVMGKHDALKGSSAHTQQSQIIVDMNTPGVTVSRPMGVFGDADAPHGHMELKFENVRVPKTNVLWGEGKGFAIAQARLGPGRIHHCMRSIGVATRALDMMIQRAESREVQGRKLSDLDNVRDVFAISELEIQQARLLTLQTAHMIDTLGSKGAYRNIAMIKIVAPTVACNVVDRAMQMFGAMGLSQDTFLEAAYRGVRTLRLADGPDEVHRRTLARQLIKDIRVKSKL